MKKMDSIDIEERRKQARAQVMGDLSWLASHPQGRRILSRFFRKARERAFSGQANATIYAQGGIDLARDILDDLRAADIALYQAAERESLEDQHGR